MKHNQLIKRLEENSGEDRKLDAEIAVALKHKFDDATIETGGHPLPHGHYLLDQGFGWFGATSPHLTSSLDACITLLREVLPGHRRYVMEHVSFTIVKVGEAGQPKMDGIHEEETYATLIAILKAVG